MFRAPPKLLLYVWMIGFALAGIANVLAPAFLGSFFVWGVGAGWQREAGIWNLAAAIFIQLALRANARDVQRALVPLLAVLSVLFAANHLIALMVSPAHLAHWAQVGFYGIMGALGLSSATLRDADESAGRAPRRMWSPYGKRDASAFIESQARGQKISDAAEAQKRRAKRPKPIEIKRGDGDKD